MTRPIVATAPWVSEEQHASAVRRAEQAVERFIIDGIGWFLRSFECCRQALYWHPEKAGAKTPGLFFHHVPKCPVCDPIGSILDDPDVSRRDAELVRLAARLADTSAVHSLLVLLDDAQRRGLTDGTPSEGSRVTRLRNPADVLEIDALRRKRGAEAIACAFNSDHACIGTPRAVHAWDRVSVATLERAQTESSRVLAVPLLVRRYPWQQPGLGTAHFRCHSVRVRAGGIRYLWAEDGFTGEVDGFIASLEDAEPDQPVTRGR